MIPVLPPSAIAQELTACTVLGLSLIHISSEIAALQGMLASDGLTGGDFQ